MEEGKQSFVPDLEGLDEGNTFSPANFASTLHQQTPRVSRENMVQARRSLLTMYLLREFTRDDETTLLTQRPQLNPLGYAVVFGPEGRFFLSARHLFNDLDPHEIIFYSEYTQEFYQFRLVEDGAEQKLDFLIGALDGFDSIDPVYPPTIKFSEAPVTQCDIAMISPAAVLFSLYQPTPFAVLQESSFVQSQEGNCGLPWLASNGGMFAIHTKRCDNPLFANMRTGLPLSMLAQRSRYFLPISSGEFRYQDASQLPASAEQFSFFTTASFYLNQIDEGGKRRDFALGPTPSITDWSVTPRQVLLRFFLQGRARLRFADNGSVSIYDFNKKYGSNAQAISNAVQQLIDDDQNKLKWEVAVYLDKNSVQQQFIPLFQSDQQGRVVSDLHMGHILPAVAFWNEGSQGFLTEIQQDAQQRQQKKELTKQQATQRVQYYTGFLAQYQLPGSSSWVTDGERRTNYITHFMHNPNNYEFETGAYNDQQSAYEKKKYGGYLAPTGYQWVDVHAQLPNKRTKFELKHTGNVNYKQFLNIPIQFTIARGQARQQYHVNAFPWLTADLAGKPRAKTDFVQRELNDSFDLYIDRQVLTQSQTVNLSNLFQTKARMTRGNLSFNQQGTFFHINYQKKQLSGKVKRNDMYDQIDDMLDQVDKIMSP